MSTPGPPASGDSAHLDDTSGLRRRINTRNGDGATANAQAGADAHKDATDKQDGPQGRTPDGTVFQIPKTHNMVSSLFDPRFPKSNIDLLTLFLLGSQIILFLTLPRTLGRWFFGLYFAFWRLAYDAGLGHVLKQQSETRWIVKTVAKNGWFDLDRKPAVARWVRNELGKKMGKDYNFEAVPLEFNVWILFRHSVDVILLNDFLSYVLFSLSFFRLAGPPGHSFLFHLLRWTGGIVLLLFNLWVKTDAHRIVKDYAWYWGDCFWTSLESLVFDGVFELAPHPMYSVGYAGYYGLSLIVASPTVLFVSLAAHAAQFGFLVYFETPHIERTYGQRKPIAARTPIVSPLPVPAEENVFPLNGEATVDQQAPSTSRLDLDNKYFAQELIVFKNWDGFRARDLAFLLVLVYAVVPAFLPSLGPRTKLVLLFLHALAWRVFHTGVLGYALKLQSEKKWIVRHFLKHYHYEKDGDAVLDAFSNFKSIYNLSLCMTYASFGALAWKCYSVPHNWTVGGELVRHTLGLLLIALHVWAALSTFEVLGAFGWFYGDFFIADYPTSLATDGIFRYLNNPERTMGAAALMGLAVLSASKAVGALTIIAVVAHWWFLSCVEKPHMQRLYGPSLRKDAGVTKTLRNAARRMSVSQKDKHSKHSEIFNRLSQNVREVQGTVEKVFEDTAEAVEEFLKRAPAVKDVVEETKVFFQQSGERLIISRVANDLDAYDASSYSLKIRPSAFPPLTPHASTSSAPSLRFPLGEPIHVSYAAPANHSRKDWIGVYRLGANKSTLVTRVSSRGKWLGVFDDEWEGDRYVEEKAKGSAGEGSAGRTGTVVFKNKKLPWRTGKYEFRYHHDGKHSVMAISEPIELFVDEPANADDPVSVKETLTHVVAKTLALDSTVIPVSARPLAVEADLRARAHTVTSDASVHSPAPSPELDRKGKQKDLSPSTGASSSSSPSPGAADPPVLLDPDDFVLYTTDEAEHIAYAIEVAFGVELDPAVVLAAANVGKLATRVSEARALLRPGKGGTGMKADLKEG
ncbi:hypothetical protein JCM10213_008612 [Rhodosporidiobolus nylandii]